MNQFLGGIILVLAILAFLSGAIVPGLAMLVSAYVIVTV